MQDAEESDRESKEGKKEEGKEDPWNHGTVHPGVW